MLVRERKPKVAASWASRVTVARDARGLSWLSVNAALRARRAGYARVGWYRGGLAAWQAAGLPVVRKSAVAVLN